MGDILDWTFSAYVLLQPASVNWNPQALARSNRSDYV